MLKYTYITNFTPFYLVTNEIPDDTYNGKPIFEIQNPNECSLCVRVLIDAKAQFKDSTNVSSNIYNNLI